MQELENIFRVNSEKAKKEEIEFYINFAKNKYKASMTHSISLSHEDTEKPQESVKNIIQNLANSIPKTISHFFPRFRFQLQKIEDCRKKRNYEISELLFGAISLFLFKQGSRNSFNNNRLDKEFLSNYEKLFGMRLPHQDTINDLFRVLSSEALEEFKTCYVKSQVRKQASQK
jgi:hypothetical protein